MKTSRALQLGILLLAPVHAPGTARALEQIFAQCTTGATCFQVTENRTGSQAAIFGAFGGQAFAQTHNNDQSVAATGNSSSGTGVFATSETWSGILGVVDSSSTAPNAIAVYGHADAVNFGIGVLGIAFADPGNNQPIGVIGDAMGPGAGVWGNTSGAGRGVYGEASGSGTAIYGDNTDPSGWAGYFEGRAFTTSGMWSGSDARLKANIRDLSFGSNALLRLRAVSFQWRKDGPDARKQLGLIAQEVREVVPEVVVADGKSGFLAVNYPALIPAVVKALQEPQAGVERRQARIAKLKRGGLGYSQDVGAGVTLGLGLPLLAGALVRRRLARRANVDSTPSS